MHSTCAPPAQLTVNIPSSSESMFISIFPLSGLKSMPIAPSMPTSSSTVITASTRGCGSSFESSTASAIATAMPSSAPSVVPRANTTSPSTARSRPSFSMSFVQSGAFSHTMSMCP